VLFVRFTMKLFVLAALILLAGCTSPGNFGIYDAKTGEILFDEEDVVYYNWTSHTITLSETGIQKLPRTRTLDMDGWHQREFMVRLGDEELYRGRFWNPISSASPDGVTIDLLRAQQEEVLVLQYSDGRGKDPRAVNSLRRHFQSNRKIEE